MRFSVWAPNAKSVDLILTARRIPLQRIDDGHWQTEIAHPRH